MTIVVTGATGVVGGHVADALARRGLPFRMLVRDAARAPQHVGAEVALGTYDDAAALRAALAPGDRVFMVSMHAPYDERVALHGSFIETAAAIGVERIVYLSFVGAGPDASFRHARSHGATEALLAGSGVSWCAVRNGMYADEVSSWFDPDGRITGPGGDGAIALSDRRELGEAIAALLAEPRHDDRQVVTIATPDALTLRELAATAAELTGRPYRYDPLPRDAWIAYRRSLGRPDWSIEAGISYYDGVARGEAATTGHDYEPLTGERPITMREVVARHVAELPLG